MSIIPLMRMVKNIQQGTLLNLLPSLKAKLLFYGKYSEISDGKMPNKLGSDWLTVTGSYGLETYKAPNTAPYIDADTDFIWFKTDETQRTTTTAELVSYDLQRTPVKYDNNTPYALREIAIIKAGETLTSTERDNLFSFFWLSILWDDSLNAFGHVKGNRITQNPFLQQEIVTYTTGLVTELSLKQKKALNKFVVTVKSGLKIINLSDAADVVRIKAGETLESSYRNIAKDAHHATNVNAIVFTPYEGIAGNGTDSYLNSNYNPATDGVTYTQNSASIIFYTRTNNFSGALFGAVIGTACIYLNIASTSIYQRINDNTTHTGIAPNNTLGMFSLIRSASNVGKAIKNKIVINNFTTVSTGVPNGNLFEGAYNNNGVAAEFTSKQLALTILGRAFTEAENTIINDAFEEYMDGNGKGVIA